MGFRRALSLFLTVQVFSFKTNGTALHNDFIEQDYMRKGQTAVLQSRLRNHLRSSNLIGQCFSFSNLIGYFIHPLSIMVGKIKSSGSFINSYHSYFACDRSFM